MHWPPVSQHDMSSRVVPYVVEVAFGKNDKWYLSGEIPPIIHQVPLWARKDIISWRVTNIKAAIALEALTQRPHRSKYAVVELVALGQVPVVVELKAKQKDTS